MAASDIAAAGGLDVRPTAEPVLATSPRVLLAEEPSAAKASEKPEPPPADDIDYRYRMAIDGVTGDLEDSMREASLLKSKEDDPPAGRTALLRRAETDEERFASVLKSRGYYAFSIKQRIDFAARPIDVRFEVDPGPVYPLAAFDIVYRDGEAPGLIHDPGRIGVEVGAAARAKPIQDATAKLLRQLGEAGYPLAKAEKRSAVVDHEAQAMRVTLKIDEGPRVVFGETRVSGLDRVQEDYVVRLADLNPGEHFNVARIDEARRRLFATGLFEGLQIKWTEEADDDGRLDVLIDLVERERRTISFGLNYSTTEGAGADIEWLHRNFFGEDEDLTLTLRAAQLEQSARAELSAPNFNRLDQRVFIAAEASREDTEAFEERALGLQTGLSRPYGDHWQIGGGGELAILETIEDDVTEQNVILAFPFFALYDVADDFFNPTKGYRLEFRVEPAAITLDTTDLLATLSAGGSVYQKLSDDDRYIAAARAKVATIIGPARDRIPAGRRLYAGGGGSIRGFEFQSVGPRDVDGDPEGGRSALEFGVELRWRVTEDIGIVPFIDGGAAFEDPVPDFANLQFAAGLGLRYFTPVGPLRLDIATPINPRDGDNLIEFYISLGQAF